MVFSDVMFVPQNIMDKDTRKKKSASRWRTCTDSRISHTLLQSASSQNDPIKLMMLLWNFKIRLYLPPQRNL